MHLHRLVLGTNPRLGAKSGVLHEWHFRTGLDHYSAVFGMLFALNYPMATAWIKRVNEREQIDMANMHTRARINTQIQTHA